jgi:hypothetical protein
MAGESGWPRRLKEMLKYSQLYIVFTALGMGSNGMKLQRV